MTVWFSRKVSSFYLSALYFCRRLFPFLSPTYVPKWVSFPNFLLTFKLGDCRVSSLFNKRLYPWKLGRSFPCLLGNCVVKNTIHVGNSFYSRLPRTFLSLRKRSVKNSTLSLEESKSDNQEHYGDDNC